MRRRQGGELASSRQGSQLNRFLLTLALFVYLVYRVYGRVERRGGEHGVMFGSMKYKATMAPPTNKSDTYTHLHIETTNHGSICQLQVQTTDAKASERCPILPSTGDVDVISDATVVYIKVCLDLLVLSAVNSFIILICCALSSALLPRLVYLVSSTAPWL